MFFSPIIYILVVLLLIIGVALCFVVRHMEAQPEYDEYKIATVRIGALSSFVLALVFDIIAIILLIMSRL